jgi:hypothetical protein
MVTSGPLDSGEDGINDPEETMSNAVATTHPVASATALEAAGTAIKLVVRVPAPLKSINLYLTKSRMSPIFNLSISRHHPD